MKPEQCNIGQKVRINLPVNPVLHGETGTICDIEGWMETACVCVRFDVYKAKFDNYNDARCGNVTVEPADLELI
jgi:hypothetical protein